MKMRIPPRMPPKMKMMSRWTSCFFSFPFWHLMTKGEWKCHLCTHLGMCRLCIELMSFPFRFKLSWSFVRTMWCENLCNECYSVLSCRTWVISKKFLLVCDIFELWIICFLFFLCSGSERPDTPGYRPDSPDILTGVSGLIPGVSGSSWQIHFLLSG
jgi:hypothetical protein